MTKKVWLGIALALAAGIALAQTYTRISYLRVLNDAEVLGDLTVTGTCTGCGGGVTTSSGTFNVSFDTGCTTTPSIVFDYVKVGDVVTLMVDSGYFSCTGDATSMADTGTPVPAALRPASPNSVFFTGLKTFDDGTFDTVGACLAIDFNGGVTLVRSGAFQCEGTDWTAAGSRGWSVGGTNSFTYLVTDP